jgi:hypothetical protein
MVHEQTRYHKIRELAQKLRGFEIVPGLTISEPTFDRSWLNRAENLLSCYPPFPPSFRNFVENVGAIQAIDVAGGLAFFLPEQILHHLTQDYGRLLSAVGEVSTFPFAANASGQYLLLAHNDVAVWKFSAHMPRVASPEQLSSGFDSFLDLLIKDWQAMLDGKGAPHLAT